MARRKNTLMDNEYADQFFGKPKSTMGKGFVGMHEETKRDMKKNGVKKLFPKTEDFI